MTDIAIIGAGLTGLTVANLLKNECNVRVFEKARGVSGRMSTRRAEPFFFDHGAQYFTARTDAFKAFIAPLIKAGIVERWNAMHCDIDCKEEGVTRHNWSEEEPRYVGVPGMNAVGRYLAKDINVMLNTRVADLKRDEKWHLSNEDGEQLGDFDWVISTAPAPQTAGLFPDDFKFHTALLAAEMLPCFAVMLGFEGNAELGFEAAHIHNSDLSWIAQNASKPERSAQSSVVIHSSHQYAKANLEADREQVMQYLIDQASQITSLDLSIASYKTIHRWLYANNEHRVEGPVMVDEGLHLGACGDWNMGGRVEGAFMSAHRLVQAMRGKLK